ncbi:valine--tRNA ligase [Natronomonas pharaonis DSM 2160]|uniref:Valine--tRNA ligase n=1 Tax=Natronomonas pharaonis (strain ATCC 35678 / DSM 2160 / CIP 103997 / JCM 8858 / NBRC 14720 / NCIMB 2260 / Gabara) TaxID=348780 RepID=SYV_NATPD|nr:valine--tRNA ligase [Natronomonas pharaonis]Q3IUE5.1 RecName: Full=Valine--tRNA ligase; AltName: Full=Valyl-tRNA synthetase; Short=ValRS [Natronomonas pharaonis DSM 2160]CAI48235.1 valine--tRNA ligase [Natronomonas pharaonis DSM 2160]
MSEVPDSYDPDEAEQKWRDEWLESDVYSYDGDEERPDYIIDTPPPYPTGNLHIGNALGWCYMDYAARYHRLQGDDVLFPQGWDCHGLPTEVKVEENRDIHRTDVSREQFREWCVEHTDEQIAAMKETMRTLGFSQDWDHEFRTMDDSYWQETQRSFLQMADSDYVYQDEHPVNWCPRCETAIADAEVENEDREGTLYYITFSGADNDDIEIATTRPELLPACVAIAVDPDDDRFEGRVGDRFEVPIFGQEVELIADDDVDGDFGTGAVMICTFGDKQDVDWWAEHDLDLRPVVTEDGHLNERAGEFEGRSIDEAKDEIATALSKSGHLHKEEPTEQSVGCCWRCDTPIEILSKEQWFVKVDQEEILETAQDIAWYPDHMYERLEEWTEGMEWDWVISRQRVFATPIPAWECADCGHIELADESEVPVDPTNDEPAVGSCPECGSDDWVGETDVMDTWMDSSISPLYVAGWPDETFEPVQLREQGHDIIRTWAFYTILRTAAVTDEIPWEEALINGMVFGDDGNKMSKSRGNFVQPEEVVEEHSADAFRQAMALGGQPGSDIQFQWKEVTSASRFQTKLWNITKFASEHIDESTPDIEAPAYRDADEWILARCARVADEVADDMDEYRFDSALRTVREFVWHDLADDYLELIKGRLYEGRPGERKAAEHALFVSLSASLRMLSPFAPFITEEAWSHLPADGSVHNAAWPDPPAGDEAAEERGELIAEVAATIRGWKSDEGKPLNADLERVEVYIDEDRPLDTYDLADTVNGPVYIEEGTPSVELVPVGVDIEHSELGPVFRDKAGEVVGRLESADPAELQAELDTDGHVEFEVDGETVTVEPEMFDIVEEQRAESGEEVVVLEADDATVLVFE